MPENRDLTEDARFLAGAAHFDRGEFFEAHEEWEALWHDTRGEPKDFVQGLIQVTSAMHQLKTGNMRGARQLHDSSAELLASYGASYLGVDLERLKAGLDNALREILHESWDRLAGRRNPDAPVKVAYTADRAFPFPWKERQK